MYKRFYFLPLYIYVLPDGIGRWRNGQVGKNAAAGFGAAARKNTAVEGEHDAHVAVGQNDGGQIDGGIAVAAAAGFLAGDGGVWLAF